MRWLFGAYQNVLHRYPKITQAVQTGLLMGSGDVISQVFIEKHPIKSLNPKRTLQFFAVGTCYVVSRDNSNSEGYQIGALKNFVGFC